MSDDFVDLLRLNSSPTSDGQMMEEAADEIDRLRAENAMLRAAGKDRLLLIDDPCPSCRNKDAEIERLRSALTEIASMSACEDLMVVETACGECVYCTADRALEDGDE